MPPQPLDQAPQPGAECVKEAAAGSHGGRIPGLLDGQLFVVALCGKCGGALGCGNVEVMLEGGKLAEALLHSAYRTQGSIRVMKSVPWGKGVNCCGCRERKPEAGAA